MPGGRAQIRLFVAIYPPPEIARALATAARAQKLPDGRLTPVRQIHMTVYFIGERPHKDLEGICESVERSASGLPAFDLTPTDLIGLPARGPARMIAARTDAPSALLELQSRLVRRLAREPRAKPSDRFLPHMTLQRFTSPTRRDLGSPLTVDPFRVTRVALVRSTLSHEGAVHEPVAEFSLDS